VLVASALIVSPQQARAETFTLRSGNGIVGGTDSQINFLLGPLDGPFPYVLSPQNFSDARAGSDAFIIAPHPAWKAALDSDALANWTATSLGGASEGSTGLYAIDFVVDSTCFSSATMDIDFHVDNDLGDSTNEGIFINEVPVVGTKLLGSSGSYFSTDQSFANLDITGSVNNGVNTLYINAVDSGGPAGLQFSATITIEQIPCPPDEVPVGGEILGIDMTSLFVAGMFTNAYWIVPAIVAGASIAVIGIRRIIE
jgi:hypothetical protein